MLNNKLTKAVRLAIAFGGASAAAFAGNVNAAEEQSAEEVERIEVTGSRIKRTDMESASPIAVYNKVEIEKTGVSTVAEFLRNTASSGGFNESATLSQSAGASSVGLKGFGSDYTLILLNGRRLPKNSAGGVFVDINQIPMAAVERIEILPDGASAIYGSDAVAGVINIITKTDQEGVSVSAKYGAAMEHRDGDELQFQFVAGATSDKTNILFAADYFERRPIMAKNRELGGAAFIDREGGEGRSTWGIPGSTYVSSPSTPDTGWAPWDACPTENIHPNGRCRYDFAPLYQLQPQSDRQSIFTSINHEYSDNLSMDAQFRYARAYTLTSNAPAPGAVDITDSPYLRDFLINDRYKDNPTLGAQIADEIAAGSGFAYVGRRYLDFPNREKDNTNETFEATTGFNYLINDDWEVSYDIGFSRLTNRQIGRNGQLLVDAVESAFADGTLNPFVINDCSSAELKDFCDGLNSSIHRTGEFETVYSNLTVGGLTGFELPGGEVGVAAGVDWRREAYTDRSDQASIDGAVIGGAGSNGGGSFVNKAFFVEFSLPLVEDMEFNIAVRNDAAEWGVDSDASETTYTAKMSYRPMDDLLLRASVGTGFKAPALDNLYLASSFGVTSAIDTKLCNAAGNVSTHPDCQRLELNSKSGGNEDLEPETSDSFNIGAVYNVTEGLSVSLDYWSLSIDNIIGSLAMQEILDEEAQGRLTDLVIRNSQGRLDDTGRTGFVQTNLQNLTESTATGLIYDVQYTTELSFGSLTANFRAEQYLSFESQTSASQPLCDYVDLDATREWRANGGFTLDAGDYTGSVNMRLLPGYDQWRSRDTINKSCDSVGHWDVVRGDNQELIDQGRSLHVATYVEFDVTGAYHIDDNNKVTVGIRNLFDRQPPFSQVNDWPFYSQSTYSNIGRFMYVQYDVNF